MWVEQKADYWVSLMESMWVDWMAVKWEIHSAVMMDFDWVEQWAVCSVQHWVFDLVVRMVAWTGNLWAAYWAEKRVAE